MLPLDSIQFSLILFLVGVGTGVTSALLGIGGGLIMVPVLSMFGIPLVKASATSLLGVLFASISSSFSNLHSGKLNWRACLMLSFFGLLTAPAGAFLANHSSERSLALGFAALLLIAIPLIDRDRKNPILECKIPNKGINLPNLWTAVIGAIAGVLSGLFGVGGGIVLVPLQVLFLNQTMKNAVRTSLGAIVIIAISGLLQHSRNDHVLWGAGASLGLGSILGAQIGNRLLRKFSEHRLGSLFRLFCVALAAYMATKGLGA